MKALIVDDELYPAKHLQDLIRKHCFEISATEIIHSPIEAMKHLQDYHYDILFLDVEMPELTGFELLKEVSLPPTTQVIFTTAYSQYAIEAFEANALHYMLKVITEDALIKAVRKASQRIQQDLLSQTKPKDSLSTISIYHREEHHIIKTEDILRMEAERGYTKVVLAGKTLLSSKGIGFYEAGMANLPFLRCHNSHIINLKKVIKLGKGRNGYVVLSNNEVVPVSESKKNRIEEALGLLDASFKHGRA